MPGTTALDSGGTRLTFTPSGLLPDGATVTVNVTGLRSTEGVTLANQTWSFTTRSGQPAASRPCSATQQPAQAAADDSSPVEVGVSFVPAKAGQVTGIRFFKGAGNTGTHKGSLWSATGTKLAEVTFVGETASGWQTAMLADARAAHGRHDLRRVLLRAQRSLRDDRRLLRQRVHLW